MDPWGQTRGTKALGAYTICNLKDQRERKYFLINNRLEMHPWYYLRNNEPFKWRAFSLVFEGGAKRHVLVRCTRRIVDSVIMLKIVPD